MTPSRWPRYAAAAFGLLWFLQAGGWPRINPLNTEWLFVSDWRQHWLGFLFFQREPWSFPLGTLSSLLYPVGTNIGLTDSNPLVAILVKPFAGILPAEFQLIGPWLAACFFLQGYMGARLASAVTRDPVQQMLGGFLFVLSPVLVVRMGHDTLCAHWILLWLLSLGLKEYPDSSAARSAAGQATVAVVLAASIHPYLAAMSWVLALAVAVRLWRSRFLGLGRAVASILTTTGGLLAVWAVIGYFVKTDHGSGGFGDYVAHVFTLIDPRIHPGASRLLPPWPNDSPAQWEGYGFLGLGGIVAGALAVVALLKHRPAWRAGAWAPILACLVLAMFALSSHVRIGKEEVLNLEWLYAPIMPLVGSFRSSGRFIWSLHYLVFVFGIWGVTRLFGRTLPERSTVALALVIILQAADLRIESSWETPKKEPQISLVAFEPARGHYRHLALAPMRVLGVCGHPYPEDYVYRFMLLAYRLGLTFNSGIYARLEFGKVMAACEAQARSVETATLDRGTIYIPSEEELLKFRAADAACGRWDGHWICVSRDSNTRFATWIETGK